MPITQRARMLEIHIGEDHQQAECPCMRFWLESAGTWVSLGSQFLKPLKDTAKRQRYIASTCSAMTSRCSRDH